MSCNYLFKLPEEQTYTHFIVEGCDTGKVAQAVIKFWLSKFPDVRPSNFEEKIQTLNYPTQVESKYLFGVSIVSERFEVSLIRRPPIKHPENVISVLKEKNIEQNAAPTEIAALVAKPISNSFELLPFFKDLI